MELIRMTAEQDAIAALAARLDAAEARIAAKLDALNVPAPSPVDLAPLNVVVDKLDALVPATAPAPAPVVDPAPVPAAPVAADPNPAPVSPPPSVPLA